jgi:hypothetical protein
MSEYQYYEFPAIDRSLTADEMSDLLALSTRAAITPVGSTNEYNWSNFKGGPKKELKEFMSVHLRRKALLQRVAKAGFWKDQ